ncbi:hypothetical protein E3Z17_00265 [Listeria monocytogenes]|nr:hypothetical protein [Listeria monocytogenes]EAG6795661.1 hypothetical protein [Listeria monocytogenes]TYV98608.1 hypothetical protein FZ070_07555 [Listeria monocytogenes]
MKKIQEKGDFMLLAVNIVIGFGILLNLSIYAYQKGSEKENVDIDLDSDNLDTRVTRSDKTNRKC